MKRDVELILFLFKVVMLVEWYNGHSVSFPVTDSNGRNGNGTADADDYKDNQQVNHQ